MNLTLRPASVADTPLLGALNRQLADDEHSRNPLDAVALAERMVTWLSGDWRAVLFECDGDVAGYAVYQVGADYYDPTLPEIYVKQFLITRASRGRGLGRRAFELFRATFPACATLSLDVLAANPDGLRFWEAIGFRPYSIAMRLP